LAVVRPQLVRHAWCAGLGAIVGAGPWIVWNLRNDWASLKAPPNFHSSYADRLADFVDRLPILVGLATPWNPNRAVMPVPVVALLLVAVVVAATWFTRDGAPALLATSIAGYGVLQSFNGLAVGVGADPRYLYPLAPALAIAAACAVAAVPQRWRGRASVLTIGLAAACTVWATIGLLDVARRPQPDQILASPGLGQVASGLERQGRVAAMTDATGHQLTYLTHGHIEAASYAVPRFADLERVGGSAGLTTYVMRTGYLGGDHLRLERYLRAHHIGFARTDVGAFTVFLLDRPVAPSDVPLTSFGGSVSAP